MPKTLNRVGRIKSFIVKKKVSLFSISFVLMSAVALNIYAAEIWSICASRVGEENVGYCVLQEGPEGDYACLYVGVGEKTCTGIIIPI